MRILSQYYKRGDLKKLRIYADDTVDGGYYNKIIEILNEDLGKFIESPTIENVKSPTTINDIRNPTKCKDLNANR